MDSKETGRCLKGGTVGSENTGEVVLTRQRTKEVKGNFFNKWLSAVQEAEVGIF